MEDRPVFANRTAMVTGGTGALGRGFIEHLLASGARVAFTWHQKQQSAQALSLIAAPCRLLGIRSDVRNPDAGAEAIALLPKDWGSVDILINNAGITHDKLLVMMQPDEWQSVIETSLMGIYSFTKPIVMQMARKRKGAVLNVASVSALKGVAGQTNYCTAKAGLLGFTRALAVEMGGFGIRVNALLPGLLDGGMAKSLNEAQTKIATQQIPLKRTGSIAEAVRVGLFLLSEDASYLTGQCIAVDGGLSAT